MEQQQAGRYQQFVGNRIEQRTNPRMPVIALRQEPVDTIGEPGHKKQY